METNLDGQTSLSNYLEMKSNLVSAPYSTQQQHLNDWNNGELNSTATWLTISVRFARKRREPLDTFWDIATWPWEKPKVRSIESHGGMRKFYRPQGRKLETNQNERISTDGRYRHDFLRKLLSFDSKLKPDIVLINESTKDIIIGELTSPIWRTGMKQRLRNTTTWRTESQKKDSFAFEVGCRGLVGKSLRKFLTALELPKKIIEETLTDCAITALKCSRKIFLRISNHQVNQRSWARF